MNYIILDLEWNISFCHWEKRFINEIIEFGAVKLDSELNEIGRFQCFVRSKLTKRLRSRVKGLTNITNEDMRSGISLEQATADFVKWAGEDTLMLTWSNTDIHVLLDNYKTLLKPPLERVPFLYKYADLQKYVQNSIGVTGNQISLTTAAEKMGVNFEEFAAHRALGDCLCSAELFRRTYDEKALRGYIANTRTKEYYERLSFKPYYINDLKNPDVDANELRFRCPECNNFMKRMAKWHFKNRSFIAPFECKNCKILLNGKVRFKKLYDSVAVTRSLTEPPPPKEETDTPQGEANPNAQNQA